MQRMVTPKPHLYGVCFCSPKHCFTHKLIIPTACPTFHHVLLYSSSFSHWGVSLWIIIRSLSQKSTKSIIMLQLDFCISIYHNKINRKKKLFKTICIHKINLWNWTDFHLKKNCSQGALEQVNPLISTMQSDRWWLYWAAPTGLTPSGCKYSYRI